MEEKWQKFISFFSLEMGSSLFHLKLETNSSSNNHVRLKQLGTWAKYFRSCLIGTFFTAKTLVLLMKEYGSLILLQKNLLSKKVLPQKPWCWIWRSYTGVAREIAAYCRPVA